MNSGSSNPDEPPFSCSTPSNSIYVLITKDPDFDGHTLVKFADMLRYQIYDAMRTSYHRKGNRLLENYIQAGKTPQGWFGPNPIHRKTIPPAKFSIAPRCSSPLWKMILHIVSNARIRITCHGRHLTTRTIIFELRVENRWIEDAMMPKEKAWGGIGLEKKVRRRLSLCMQCHALDISTKDDVFQSAYQ